MSPASLAAVSANPAGSPRHLWQVSEILALYEMPLMDLLWRAQGVHRQHFDANAVQRSTLLSVKTGGCSEDCGYCSQSARHHTGLERERLLPVDEVVAAAKVAKDKGASRFCMGAAWRGPKDNDLEHVLNMVREVKALGMQTCVTLGMLKEGQAEKLKEAGLDYYNHNLDTDKDFYGQVIKTHTHDDRLDTLSQVRDAGISVCSGGIIGMGESRKNRAAMIVQLANLPTPPESVPINNLVPIPGTPLADVAPLDPFEFVRTIAAARIAMPTSWVRLSAGRGEMSDELQALCFLAGANSMFYGDQLLTTGNPDTSRDDALFERLGLTAVNGGFVDTVQVRRRFARAAAGYGEADFFAREIDRRMQERLDYVRIAPAAILDLGCSRGASLGSLRERYPDAAALGVDIAPQMLQVARPPKSAWPRWLKLGREATPAYLAADAARLPLRGGSVGLVWSNLLLHWLDDPLPALREAHRVLETGGLLMFSTLGPDTFKELRGAFADGYAHTQRTIDMHDLGDMLVETGFADPVMDMEVVRLTYDSVDAMLAELRAAGSACAMKARRHGLTGKGTWAAVRTAYESLRQDGKLPATFEVVYGHAWKAAPKQTEDGRAIVRFAPKSLR